jgi:hypothetical protein
MVTDQQVRRLFKLVQTERSFGIAAAKAGMDEKTARKYRKLGRLPSEIKKEHTWRPLHNLPKFVHLDLHRETFA